MTINKVLYSSKQEDYQTPKWLYVIDLNNKADGPKPWDVSKTSSVEIDYFLKQGNHILKVERAGSGMKTKYHFTPVVSNTTSDSSAAAAL